MKNVGILIAFAFIAIESWAGVNVNHVITCWQKDFPEFPFEPDAQGQLQTPPLKLDKPVYEVVIVGLSTTRVDIRVEAQTNLTAHVLDFREKEVDAVGVRRVEETKASPNAAEQQGSFAGADFLLTLLEPIQSGRTTAKLSVKLGSRAIKDLQMNCSRFKY